MPEYEPQWRLNSANGLWVDENTGETTPAPWRYLEPGSEYHSPAQVKRNHQYGEMMKKKLEQAQNEQFARHIRTEQEKKLGQFTYIKSTEDAFQDLSPATLTRAAYLSTFIKFETDELWRTSRTQMKRTDLPDVMRLSGSKANSFWSEVREKYFFRDEHGFLHTANDEFIVGRLFASPNVEYQKLRRDAFRGLYEKINPRQHKRLGYVLKMLPFLNFEFNVLCLNPMQKDKDKIIPLTVENFCEAVGFDKANMDKLARDYGRIRFTVDGKEEVFCKFLYDGSNLGAAHIFVNPRLVYKGNNFWKVEAIAASFAASARATK